VRCNIPNPGGLTGAIRLTLLLTLVALGATTPALAQERFSFFLASTPESVERMLTLAALRDDDVVDREPTHLRASPLPDLRSGTVVRQVEILERSLAR
jgi:hypothetical protein